MKKSDAIVLSEIDFDLEPLSIVKLAEVPEGTADADELLQLILRSQAVARPRALYRTAYVENRGDDFVVVEGMTFRSRVLRVNLEGVDRVFPFVTTCGRELAALAESSGDPRHSKWSYLIQGLALLWAMKALISHIEENHQTGHTAMMNPGSLADWPLSEQGPLFSLLRDVKGAIGVELQESMFMNPVMTVSGLRFPNEEGFESCQLCPKENCPNRRAAFDRSLFERRYRL